MKYKSDNKSVARALNKAWIMVGIPFFTILFTSLGIGFWMVSAYELTGAFMLIFIAGGILMAGLVGHQLSKFWFANQLDVVSDQSEFIQRAKRLQMIWPSTADRIIEQKGITPTKRKHHKKQSLPPLKFEHEMMELTHDSLILKGKKYAWEDVKDFKITVSNPTSGGQHYLELSFKNSDFIRESFHLKNGSELDYQLDRYLANSRIESPEN